MPRRSLVRESAIQSAVVEHWRVLGLPNTLVAAIPNAGALGQAGLNAGLSISSCSAVWSGLASSN